VTDAEIIRRAPGRNVVRVDRVAEDIPPRDKDAWLLVLRDWCKAQRYDIRDYAVRVWERHHEYVHATH
jgi:hypothetical protein